MLRFSSKKNIPFQFGLLAICLTLSTLAANAQAQKTRATMEEVSPVLHEYRGVTIGMPADDVRKKLGTPSDKAEEQDFFVLSDNETAQVVYDKSRKVVTISFDFMNGASNVPTPKDIFGSDIEAKSDGSAYRMVRYPKAGYWLSYNRTAGNAPLTSITFQKIER